MASLLRRLLAPTFRNGAIQNRLLNTTTSGDNNNISVARNIYLKYALQNQNKAADTSIKIRMLPSSIINLNEPLSIRKSPMLDLPKLPFSPELPTFNIIPKLDIPIIDTTFECPNGSAVIEKQAVRLIVIRRKKMNKHKLKKLRKRQKFETLKRKQRNNLRKEKHFHLLLSNQMKKADRFSPEEYVKGKLAAANRTPLPDRFKGKRYPRFIIRQLLGLDPMVKYKQY